MTATQREKQIHGEGVEVLGRDEDCTIYRLSDDKGDVVMTSYHVFPGIDLIYNDVHMRSCTIGRAPLGDMIEINHCREGRIECELRDEFFYLSQGDLAISRKDDAGHASYFPLSHYHGITIMIDLERTPCCLECFLKDVDVCPSSLADKFCGGSDCFVMRARPCMEHIFSELYSVPDCIRKGYFKVKILEILLFLSGMESDKNTLERCCYPAAQVALAKEVCRYLSEHMDCRVTISQLAERFKVSQTLLKDSFRGVYGVSVYAWIRTQKMRSAALMLLKTDKRILDIAGRHGYDNGSKFAKAFQDVMGMTPNAYRYSVRADGVRAAAAAEDDGGPTPNFL